MNPFLSPTYSTKWLQHFHPGKSIYRFISFPDLSFIKTSLLPIYKNVCGLNTKTVDYEYTPSVNKEYKGKIFIVFDVPSHSPGFKDHTSTSLKILKSKQYPGFLCDLSAYKNLEDYMLHIISSKSRSKFRFYRRKLEKTYGITYKMFDETTTEEEYNQLFIKFEELLHKRFLDKKTINANLNKDVWDFYHDVTYPMMLEKKASIFVTFNQNDPIAITLLYLNNNITYDTIRVFDIDYAKYRLGTVSIMALLDWCFKHNIQILDFSKGYFEYKERWTNKSYHFDYHIVYDSSSHILKIIAYFIYVFYNLKQQLREKNVNQFYHHLIFFRERLLKKFK